MKNSSRHSTLLSAKSSLRVLGASKRQAFPSPAFLSYGPFVLGPFCPQAFLSVYRCCSPRNAWAADPGWRKRAALKYFHRETVARFFLFWGTEQRSLGPWTFMARPWGDLPLVWFDRHKRSGGPTIYALPVFNWRSSSIHAYSFNCYRVRKNLKNTLWRISYI